MEEIEKLIENRHKDFLSFDNKQTQETIIYTYLPLKLQNFSEYLANRDNFLNFLQSSFLQISKYKHHDDGIEFFLELKRFSEKTSDTTFNFNQEILKKALMCFYTKTVFSGISIFEDENHEYCHEPNIIEKDGQKYYYDDNEILDEYEHFYDYGFNKTNRQTDVETLIKKQYVEPILNKLYCQKMYIKKTISNDFISLIALDYYEDILSNTFRTTKSYFLKKCKKFSNTYLRYELKVSFENEYNKSQIILEEIESLLTGIFLSTKTQRNAIKKLLPILHKSKIIEGINVDDNEVNKYFYALNLQIALEEYLFILCLTNATIECNYSNKTIAKYFYTISRTSKTLDFINETIKINKTEIKYLLFSFLKKHCYINDIEVKYLIDILNGYKFSTYKKNEQYLPKITTNFLNILG
jgi:hypothetical protein